MELCYGRPESDVDREEKEVRVYDLLDQLAITYERVDHEPANTMEACKEIDKILTPAVICKNLFLCNSQQTKFYLLMIRGDKKFKTKDISKQINSARLSFAPAEKMQEYLDLTPGSVSVMGLMNDRDRQVQLLVDEDVLHSEFFGCHPCVNTSSLRIRTKDVFETFLQAVNHDYIAVQLPEYQKSATGMEV
ncbi:MAG: prolyl-tRNA synthetase associated domain-containing protein [Clostridiales bacterium]|nr:prolyl-tRNA synthetase associated domain-containing protein [Clostridiales bacterium]